MSTQTFTAVGNTRLTIYIPAQLDERIRRAAERAGQSLSVWMQRAAEAALFKESLDEIKQMTREVALREQDGG